MVPSSFNTMQLSEILSTIFCRAIGVTPKKLNLKIAKAQQIIATENVIGVAKTVIGINFRNEPNTFTVIGIANPRQINRDCLEKNPEFLSEKFNKRKIPKINKV